MSEIHECKREKDFDRILAHDEEMQKQIEERVKWTMFWAILVVLFGLLGTLFSNLYSQMDEHEELVHKQITVLQADSKETDLAQVRIETQLAEIYKQLAEINVKLGKR